MKRSILNMIVTVAKELQINPQEFIDIVKEDYEESDINYLEIQDLYEIADASGLGMVEDEEVRGATAPVHKTPPSENDPWMARYSRASAEERTQMDLE